MLGEYQAYTFQENNAEIKAKIKPKRKDKN